jgi:hypothetical protein
VQNSEERSAPPDESYIDCTPHDRARAIVAATLAANLARAVAAASGWLCVRWHKIGRVDANAI